MTVRVTCLTCYATTEVSTEDRDCDNCGEYVPDEAIEPLEDTITTRD